MIETIRFNWFYTNEVGEGYDEYTVGSNGVLSIKETETEFDRYFTVKFEDGHIEEIYNINLVVRD